MIFCSHETSCLIFFLGKNPKKRQRLIQAKDCLLETGPLLFVDLTCTASGECSYVAPHFYRFWCRLHSCTPQTKGMETSSPLLVGPSTFVINRYANKEVSHMLFNSPIPHWLKGPRWLDRPIGLLSA